MDLPLPAADSALWLALCILGGWRITALVLFESGPYDAFVRLRRGMVRIGLDRMVSCFHCTSLWVCLGLTLAVFGVAPATPLLWFGIAGGASALERWLGEGVVPSREEQP